MTSTGRSPSSSGTGDSPPRLIETEADLAEGAAWLAAADPRLRAALEAVGPLPLRRRADGFAALFGAIVSQQVSVAAADAILGRCREAGFLEPAVVVEAGDEALRAPGLSCQKVRYVRALAGAGIDYDALRRAETEEVVATLTALPGIGRWTAEIYAMFSLGHRDVFAPADLALQEGARMVLGLPERPKEGALREMAEAWRPWRAVAARLLWAYYAREKRREGVR
jgi:DNA-3-methyladenine glycosylase II